MSRAHRRRALTSRDLGVIDIERRWGPGPSSQGMKFDDARRLLGLDPRGYGLVLNALIDDPAAHAHDPRTMARLKEIRDQRRLNPGA